MIVFVHLLNDRSGSPKVLLSVIKGWVREGHAARLFVGSGERGGCLDDAGVPTTRFWYRRGSHRLVTLFTYLGSQICLFFRLLLSRDIPRDAAVYVNTLLPFGAALYGHLTRRPVIYHLHEVSVRPALLRHLLCGVARGTARQLIYVSEFHRSCIPLDPVPSRTIYNGLDERFVQQAQGVRYQHRHDGIFRVLMLASLRDYKGIPEFLRLANAFSNRNDIRFHLIANDDYAAVTRYFSRHAIPPNLEVGSRTSDIAVQYAAASLVLNLSRVDEWIETFGLTLLEAMTFGVPVIAPPAGGPLELFTDGREGFFVDSREPCLLESRVRELADDPALCHRMSIAARLRAARFSQQEFLRELHAAIDPHVTA
jgi:L-malate glycosyltransferase